MFFKLLHTSDQSKQLCFNSYLNYVNRKAPGRLGKDIMLSAAFYTFKKMEHTDRNLKQYDRYYQLSLK